jgi:hypothetical protein
VARSTVGDAQAIWLMTAGQSGNATVAGLYGGTLSAAGRTIKLTNYSLERGVRVNGTLTLKKAGPPLVFQGPVTVAGTAAAHGLLGLNGSSLRGTLGGTAVG